MTAMRDFVAALPQKVRLTAVAQGREGREWLSGLNAMLARLEKEWTIEIGEVAGHGTEAFCAEARTKDGADVYLKVILAGIDPKRQELRILDAAEGVGYAELLRADETANAMLLERLGPELASLSLPEEKQIEVLCAALREAWCVKPVGPLLPTGIEKAFDLTRLIDENWAMLGEPVTRETVALAMRYAQSRRTAFERTKSVILHGDAHAWNALVVPGAANQCKFVDPDGVFGERAYDLAISMREWTEIPSDNPKARAETRLRLLAHHGGVDAQAIREWSLLHLLANGLELKQLGIEKSAVIQLTMAEALAAGAS